MFKIFSSEDVFTKPSQSISATKNSAKHCRRDPNIMKKLQVDQDAIKFVLASANIMCLDLTSPGGALDDEVEAETPVAIMAEGKQHVLAIGFTKMSTKDM